MTSQSLRTILADYAAITGIQPDTRRLHEICLTHLERFLGHEPLVADLTDLTYGPVRGLAFAQSETRNATRRLQ